MILVLDDHPVSRQGLESIIRMYKPDEEVLQAGSVREAIEQTEKRSPDMAFIDINLGVENGFEFLQWLIGSERRIKTFMITSSSDANDFYKAKEMGVDAYLLKDSFIDDIMYGLRVVERGEKFYSTTLLSQMDHISDEERLLYRLTKRELEVLRFLSNGYSNSRIGECLYVSEGTVKKHISNILGKLDVENRVEAMLFAGRNSAGLQRAMEQAKS